MSLHHLDPRNVESGKTPDVETIERLGEPEPWTANVKGGSHWYGDTEHAALHAARQAAGFGHVAEQACATFAPPPGRLYESLAGPCAECAWPRTRHPKP